MAVEAGDAIFASGDDLERMPVYHVITGLVRLDIAAKGCPVTIYSPPDSLIGIVEVMAGTRRLMDARALEKTTLAASPQWSSRLLLSLSGRIRAMIEKLGSVGASAHREAQ